MQLYRIASSPKALPTPNLFVVNIFLRYLMVLGTLVIDIIHRYLMILGTLIIDIFHTYLMILGSLIIILTLCLLCSHRKDYNYYKSLKILVINNYSFLLQIFNDRSTYQHYLFLLQIINDRSTFRALSHPWSHHTLPQRPHTSRSHFRLEHKAWSSKCNALCIEKNQRWPFKG